MLFFVRQVKKLAFNIEEEKQFGELYSIVIMETKFFLKMSSESWTQKIKLKIFFKLFSDTLECYQYSIGEPPFTVTAFHDGTDALTLDWIEVG